MSVFPLDNDIWTRLFVYVIAVRCTVFDIVAVFILGRFNGGPVRSLTSRGYSEESAAFVGGKRLYHWTTTATAMTLMSSTINSS